MSYEPEHLKLWTHPENYIGASWPATYSAGVGQHRDSDALERSNFRCMLKALGGESETVTVVRESHWAVGWIEWIAIHQDDDKALETADRVIAALEDYPVIDESDWSELENEDANDTWTNCFSDRDRLDYIRHNRSQFDFRGYDELIANVRGRYFSGYASELLN